MPANGDVFNDAVFQHRKCEVLDQAGFRQIVARWVARKRCGDLNQSLRADKFAELFNVMKILGTGIISDKIFAVGGNGISTNAVLEID